ncbi:MAG TPA: hypothetical protein VHX64_03955 [Caulobacteraceae bacterium]|nr:hypothetical protein [Caulobacteraceae bacterium]
MAALIALSLLVAGQALAAAADVPSSNAESDILRWIAQRTSISRRLILIVEPRAVVALASGISMGPGSVARAELREELIGPDAKTRSALFFVDLDCTTRKYRIAERELYPLPDLKGAVLTDLGHKPWAAIDEAAPIGKAWLAACTTGFVFPYATQSAGEPAPTPPPAPVRKPPPPPTQTVASAPAPRPVARAAPAATSAPTSVPTPAARGAYEAVLGAFEVKANALAASDKVDRLLAHTRAGRRKTLGAATVNGKVFTVLKVSGFSSAADAASFCSSARAVHLDCVAKKGGN